MNITHDKAIEKIAKKIVKELKEGVAENNVAEVGIPRLFCTATIDGVSGVYYYLDESKWYEKKNHIYFGDLDNEGLAGLTREVASKVMSLLKVSKKAVVIFDSETRTHWGMWSSHDYEVYKSVMVAVPCKEFVLLNKKLVKIGAKEIPLKEWWSGSTAGKRDRIFDVEKEYHALDSAKCNKVLDYLKGKKRLSYEIIREDDDHNRAYGIEYETEWYGHIYHYLKFTDAKGKTYTI